MALRATCLVTAKSFATVTSYRFKCVDFLGIRIQVPRLGLVRPLVHLELEGRSGVVRNQTAGPECYE